MARLIGYADRMGIERLVVFMGERFVTDPSPDELRRQNDEVLQALSHWHHRAFGFVYVSPNHVEASLREIDRCVRDGPMVGVKLWVAERCDCPEADALVRRADRAEGGRLPAHLDQGRRQPAGRIDADGPGGAGGAAPSAVAHLRPYRRRLGAGHPRRPRLPNVAIDLAGSDPTAGFGRDGRARAGRRRVIYGSDVPGRSFASQLAKVLGAEIPDDARRLILGENLRRLLGADPPRQGRQAMIDVNVSLSRWPFRRLPDDEPEALARRSAAWA